MQSLTQGPAKSAICDHHPNMILDFPARFGNSQLPSANCPDFNLSAAVSRGGLNQQPVACISIPVPTIQTIVRHHETLHVWPEYHGRESGESRRSRVGLPVLRA